MQMQNENKSRSSLAECQPAPELWDALPTTAHSDAGLSIPAGAAPGHKVTCLEELADEPAWQVMRAKKDRPATVGGTDPIADIERLGVVMAPELDNPTEALGVLNPAAARGRDGALYLFARAVAAGNYSRLRMARLLFDPSGRPRGVERLGFALEPSASYEALGCEDPRITFMPALDRYAMTYTALGPSGARVAIAVSSDLFHWTRLGLVEFGEEGGTDFDALENKDAVFFPQPVTAPDGTLSFACLHRPMTGADRRSRAPSHLAHLPSSIWLSWVPVTDVQQDLQALTRLRHHHLLLTPGYSWEQMKLAAGTPPILTRLGWLVFHHGVQSADLPGSASRWRYSAGAFVLDSQDLTRVIWRSPSPLLTPLTQDETYGVVDNVVFSTGVDAVDERTLDLYYGMADARIGVARVRLNEGAALHPLDGTESGQALPGPGNPLSPLSHMPHLPSRVDDIDERLAA